MSKFVPRIECITTDNPSLCFCVLLLLLSGFHVATPPISLAAPQGSLRKAQVEVKVGFGEFTPEEIEAFQSLVPDENMSTRTPPPKDLKVSDKRLTIVVDFKEPGEPLTTDVIGNVAGPIDVTSFGFASVEFDAVTDALLANVREDFSDSFRCIIESQNGQGLDLNIIEGEIGVPPAGIEEYYFVQVGSAVEGPFSNVLGVTFLSAIRDASGNPNTLFDIGDVVASVFTNNIQDLSSLTPFDALSRGSMTFTSNALGSVIGHEIGHTLSLSHINVAGSVQPTGNPPLMGTGAIDMVNQSLLSNRELSVSGFNDESDGVPVFQIDQLAGAVGLDGVFEAKRRVIGRDNFDGFEQFISRTLTPDNGDPGDFGNSNLDFFGFVDRRLNSLLEDNTLSASNQIGFRPTTEADRFLAHGDLGNPNNPNGTGIVEYVFDIGGAENMLLSIDIAAMGNFESVEDSNAIVMSIDGGPEETLLELIVEESLIQAYFFENGDSMIIADPLSVQGNLLSNEFQTFNLPIFGSGSELTIRFDFAGAGGGEVVAFNNLLVSEELVSLAGDVNCDGVVDLLDVDPFVDAIASPKFDVKADVNGDGIDDLLDVAPFVAILAGS